MPVPSSQPSGAGRERVAPMGGNSRPARASAGSNCSRAPASPRPAMRADFVARPQEPHRDMGFGDGGSSTGRDELIWIDMAAAGTVPAPAPGAWPTPVVVPVNNAPGYGTDMDQYIQSAQAAAPLVGLGLEALAPLALALRADFAPAFRVDLPDRLDLAGLPAFLLAGVRLAALALVKELQAHRGVVDRLAEPDMVAAPVIRESAPPRAIREIAPPPMAAVPRSEITPAPEATIHPGSGYIRSKRLRVC